MRLPQRSFLIEPRTMNLTSRATTSRQRNMSVSTPDRTSASVGSLLAMAFVFAFMGAGDARSVDAANHIATVQSDVKRILRATYDADAETVFGYAHPKVIELMGGADNARALLISTLARMQHVGMKLESLEFPNPPRFIRGRYSTIVFIPTLVRVSGGSGRRAESRNFQAGVLEDGASQWTYVEGSRLNASNIQVFFPDIPQDIELPPIHRRKVQ